MTYASSSLRPDFSLIVPTYNERERLAALIEEVFAVCGASNMSPEVIVVDDNSPDGTGARAERLAERWPVRVIHRARKLGLGSAVLDGLAAAAGDVVAVMDADLSHPPQLLPTLVAPVTTLDADMVVASRYVTGGRTEKWPLTRLAMSRLACWAARPLTPLKDPMSGFFAVRRELVTGVRTSAAGFKVGLELLVRSRPSSVAEVAYTFTNRAAGRSKMSPAEVVRYGRQLLALFYFSARAHTQRPRYSVLPAPKTIEGIRPVEPPSAFAANVVRTSR